MKYLHKIIGTLVPVSALYSLKNSSEPIGNFEDGLLFLDWLKNTRQTAWQMLPLHETQLQPNSLHKHVPSPYKSYGIGLDPKYLPKKHSNILPTIDEKKYFILKNHDWINDYALFCALRDYFQTDNWTKWNADLKHRDKKSLAAWKEKLVKQVDHYVTLQWQLEQSYLKMKDKAASLGIMIIGDLSYYVSFNSPLVWAHQNLFQIPKDGDLQYVSGIPNGPSSHFGRQVWGHPLYDWRGEEQERSVINFWKMRLNFQARLFDLIRLDHAKALFTYGVINLHNEKDDTQQEGPGIHVLEELIKYSRAISLSIFAEDSGDKVAELRKSLKHMQIPGIKIFRFAFNEKRKKINKEYSDVSKYQPNTVAYTTTHDTETLLDYLQKLTLKQKLTLALSSGVIYHADDKIFAKLLRGAVLSSPANIVMIPIQDWLLTTDRINVPGTERTINDKNWQFRLTIPIEQLPRVNEDAYNLYIVRASDNSLYCGITNDLQKRINDHNSNNKKGAKYLRGKKPVELVYLEKHENKSSALKREAWVKKLSKEKKETLIAAPSTLNILLQ